MPERPLPKMAVETAANKKKPLNPPNSMIGQFTAVLGTAVFGNGLYGMIPFMDLNRVVIF